MMKAMPRYVRNGLSVIPYEIHDILNLSLFE